MKKILVVDDDKNARAVLRDILIANAYDVMEAGDGQEALGIVHRDSVDLIITDRSMPGLDGLALLRALREEKRGLPVLMISAYGEERLWAEAIGLGAKDYILKPFDPDSVLKEVRKYLGASR